MTSNMKLLLLNIVAVTVISATPFNNSSISSQISTGSRIINGTPASVGQFPWQIAIYFVAAEGKFFCGGSLIHPQWVLTAAHCVLPALDPSSFTLYGGIIDLNQFNTPIQVKQGIPHEGYNSSTLEHDIGVLELFAPLDLGDNIGIIALADIPLEENVRVTVSGWGKTSDDSVTVSQFLNYVELETISNVECDSYFPEGTILDGMVCAAAGQNPVTSTCSGDSGGPMVTDPTGSPVQVGVVSFVGDLGCEHGDPSGYSRVAYYREWIKLNTGV